MYFSLILTSNVELLVGGSMPLFQTCLEIIDDYTFASGSKDSTIKIWDIYDFECLKTLFSALNNQINCLKSFDEVFIASGSLTHIHIWNIDTGTRIHDILCFSNWVYDLIYLPDGTLVSSSGNSTIQFWELNQQTCFKKIEDCTTVYCLLLLKTGQLASGSLDSKIKIWNMENRECVKTLTGHESYILKLQSLESGELISCSNDKTIKIWDLDTGSCTKTLTGHIGLIKSIKVKKDGSLVSCSSDGKIKIWDLKMGQCIDTIEANDGKAIYDFLLI